jgi:hypothetical protein
MTFLPSTGRTVLRAEISVSPTTARGVLVVQLAISVRADRLASRAPRNDHVLLRRGGVIRKNHQSGEAVGIDKESDVLHVIAGGINLLDGLNTHLAGISRKGKTLSQASVAAASFR